MALGGRGWAPSVMSHPGQPADAKLIEQALAGRRAEMNRLVSRLLPVIRRRALDHGHGPL